jgi:peptidoglycan/LPS O-acetylase OafA/YrhL
MSSAPARIRSLDGLRAVSIVLVFIAHLAGTRGAPDRATIERIFGDSGNFGVRVFFVISGFLITNLLFEEQRKTGTISLRGFYLRRTFRIFPAFYAYLLVVFVAAQVGLVALRPWDMLAASTYTINYHYDRSWYVGHIWSLSVEEQFYLVWPALLLMLGARSALWTAVCVTLVAPVVRVTVMRFVPAWRAGVGESFPTVADAIAAGCLLAALRDRLWAIPRVQRALASGWFVLVPLSVVAANRLPLRFALSVGETIMNLGIALIVERAVRFPDGLTGRFLNARPVAYVGSLSYSLYLWQQPFFNRHSEATVASFPLNLAIVIVLAVASHHLIEKPFLRLRGRFDRRPVAAAAPAQPAQP